MWRRYYERWSAKQNVRCSIVYGSTSIGSLMKLSRRSERVRHKRKGTTQKASCSKGHERLKDFRELVREHIEEQCELIRKKMH